MFKSVSGSPDVQAVEEDQLAFWRDKDILRRTMSEREGSPTYVFYEGPPTANGRPGSHHVLSRSFKDIFPRYKTMNGYYVLRKAGWDTHGLPVEIAVEKELGFNNKQDIEEYGIAAFNEKCRESVLRYIEEWEDLTERIAFWVDTDQAYYTFTNDYIQSIWWILSEFWKKDLLYEGYKVVPYCPRCGTPLSSHEVNQGYDQTDDPSLYVRFAVSGQEDTYLLAWTTTPWTLPGNVALAVGEDIDYVKLQGENEHGKTETIYAAAALLTGEIKAKKIDGDDVTLDTARENVLERLRDYQVVERLKGANLVGMSYEPLFEFMPIEPDATHHVIVAGDFVSTQDGTGIVHMAPAFGADDLAMGQKHNLPVLLTVDADGKFIEQVTSFAGLWVKDADPRIVEALDERELVFKHGKYKHRYPFCWRCDTPLLYYARPTWFIRTSSKRDELVALNKRINWTPEHIRDGRFGNWLENNIDWALGRERYWGTPLPVWACEDCGHQHCVSGIEELQELTGEDLSDLDLHRPYVDEVTWTCQQPDCAGGTMRRVPEVIDVWFDSGAMPYAQWGYPHQHQEEFKSQYPADYICEAIDQTRGWFYSLHAISTLLNDQVAIENVICLGFILDGYGKNMSKRRGNVVDP
ncbi:MAG: isoleucine--tRNA ligase [Anaerolineae bacterium]